MLLDTRTSIHFGVNFLFAPQPVLDPAHQFEFQRRLAGAGLLFTTTTTPPGMLIFQRAAPPLEVRVAQPGPPVGQLMVQAPQPARTLEEFEDEARSACDAFTEAWPGNLQVIQRDCIIRHLYDVASDHAFRYLWEDRLRQPEAALNALGRPIQGGGLRLVIPAAPEADAPQVEVKVESLLADARKLYVDVQMTWVRQAVGPSLEPTPLLEETHRYATTEVVAFITGAQS